MTLINWRLLANPYNWLVVFLMLAIFGIGAGALHRAISGGNSNAV